VVGAADGRTMPAGVRERAVEAILPADIVAERRTPSAVR
jgi:hypothetical protein